MFSWISQSEEEKKPNSDLLFGDVTDAAFQI